MFRVAVADWDETITCHDTIQHVAAAAYARKPHYRPHFDHFTEVYAAAYNEFARTATPEPSFAGELRYQKQLRKVEMALINEIERLRLFQGMEPLDLQRQAVHAQLQPHFVEFARVCQLRAVPLVILSLNWSHVFIEAALRLHGVLLSNVEIISNDLEFSDNVATGLFDRAVTVRTGADKLAAVQKIGVDGMLYVGDSRSDVLAIVASHTGVVFQKHATAEVARLLGASVNALAAFDRARNAVYFATDWLQITSLLSCS